MIQAYNYLLESYPIQREVKYPAHKRSELKKVYNSIVNLSKASPLYKINLSRENQEFTIGVKETAIALKTKLDRISNPENSGFQSKSVAISDKNVISAELLSQDTEGFPENITFTVNCLASVQINRGKDLLQTSKALMPGEYHFRAMVMNETYELSFSHPQRTENGESLKDMAEFLDKSVPGINAVVEKGDKQDYNRIVIVSEKAAKSGENVFCFEDDGYFDVGVVDFFGLNRTQKAATSAQFELNGIPKQTMANTFNLENKLKITLHNTSEEPVNIKLVSDSEKILSSVDSVLTSCNNLLRIAKDRTLGNKEHYRASKLINEIKSLENVYKEELDACGLKADEDGILLLDNSLAVQAAQDGGMESLFTRENGFIARLINKADDITINPMEYLDKTIVTYPNSSNKSYCNPYVTSMYSGLFFSSYC